MAGNNKSYGKKHRKANREMWEADGEWVAFLCKESERVFLERRRLSRGLKGGHADEMHSCLQST